jgi:hypothetical protein
MTRDSAGTGINLYVNGQFLGSTTMAAAPDAVTGTEQFQVGKVYYVGTNGIEAIFHSIRITKAEFTAAQALEAYQQARGVA